MVIKAGILSDTHLVRPDNWFKKQVRHCFHDCEVIIHAGDITDPSVLDVFAGFKLFAVHGNMCNAPARTKYPVQQQFSLGGFNVGLTHGAGLGADIEAALFNLFPAADCMIYGHTHRPSLHQYGPVLILNPGSFQGTGRFGAPGTYGIIAFGDQMNASLHEIPPLS
jgi:putative phosphoesterase